MIANDIMLSSRTSANLRMRYFYNECTSLPAGTPTEWDGMLKRFDPELSLRFNNMSKLFLIYYDHHGKLSVIRSFAIGESFGKAFRNVMHNSSLSLKRLRRMRVEEKETEEKRVTDTIRTCSEEFGRDLHMMTKAKVSTDSVDAFAPEKPSVGGVML